MSTRHPLLFGTTFALGGLALGWLLAPSSAGQAPAAPANLELRYQAVPVGNYIVVTDPVTGECWTRLVQEPQIKDPADKAWVPMGSPIRKK